MPWDHQKNNNIMIFINYTCNEPKDQAITNRLLTAPYTAHFAKLVLQHNTGVLA